MFTLNHRKKRKYYQEAILCHELEIRRDSITYTRLGLVVNKVTNAAVHKYVAYMQLPDPNVTYNSVDVNGNFEGYLKY